MKKLFYIIILLSLTLWSFSQNSDTAIIHKKEYFVSLGMAIPTGQYTVFGNTKGVLFSFGKYRLLKNKLYLKSEGNMYVIDHDSNDYENYIKKYVIPQVGSKYTGSWLSYLDFSYYTGLSYKLKIANAISIMPYAQIGLICHLADGFTTGGYFIKNTYSYQDVTVLFFKPIFSWL